MAIIAISLGKGLYAVLAAGVLVLHALFVLWVAAGTLVTRSRPVLRWFHIASLFWGILAEVAPWPCPLTTIENWLEGRAGVQPYQGGFLLHYLDALVYPDVSPMVLMIAGISVCALNLAVYARRFIERNRR
jgi:hypothetical protein